MRLSRASADATRVKPQQNQDDCNTDQDFAHARQMAANQEQPDASKNDRERAINEHLRKIVRADGTAVWATKSHGQHQLAAHEQQRAAADNQHQDADSCCDLGHHFTLPCKTHLPSLSCAVCRARGIMNSASMDLVNRGGVR
jgi:hypothetical protein